jgi:predicted PurR-regulated permease PerM
MASFPTFTRNTWVAVGIVALVLALWKIAPVLMLFFAGVVFATAIRAGAMPLVRRLRMNETLAVAIVFSSVVALVALGGYLFGREIGQQATELWDALKDSAAKVERHLEGMPLGAAVVESVKGYTDSEALSRVAKGTFIAFGGLADVALVLFLAMYLAVDPGSYRNGLLLLLSPSVRERVGDALDASGIALRKWLAGQLGAMVIVGILTGLGLAAIGVPLAVPLAILSGLLDFVPVIGPLVAAIPGLLIAFAQSPQVALYAALVYITVQFVEGHLVLPLAQKWAVSLPPALSLLGIVAFGLLFGPMGVLFAMPLTVVLVVLVKKLHVDRHGG